MFVRLTTKNPSKTTFLSTQKRHQEFLSVPNPGLKVEVAVDGLAVEDIILSTCVLGREGENSDATKADTGFIFHKITEPNLQQLSTRRGVKQRTEKQKYP